MSQHNILRFPCHNRCDILSLEEVSSVSVHGQRKILCWNIRLSSLQYYALIRVQDHATDWRGGGIKLPSQSTSALTYNHAGGSCLTHSCWAQQELPKGLHMSHSIQVVRSHPPDLQPHHRPLPHIYHVHTCQYKRHHAVTCCAEASGESIGGRRVGGGG